MLNVAAAVAARTTCPRALKYGGVGAVVTTRESHRILGVGYCGAPPGLMSCLDVGCQHFPSDEGCHRTVHAEMNAILFMRPFEGWKTLYTTLSPCLKCLQHACVVGVSRVVFRDEYRINEPQRVFCDEAVIEWVHLGQ